MIRSKKRSPGGSLDLAEEYHAGIASLGSPVTLSSSWDDRKLGFAMEKRRFHRIFAA